jgi:hypothetical protein
MVPVLVYKILKKGSEVNETYPEMLVKAVKVYICRA